MISGMAISRRQFGRLTGATVVTAAALPAQSRLTAQQVVERIQKNVGVPWQAETLDGFKAGEPTTPVTGIATTAMATMDVLSRAVREKANLVITLEPVFFSRTDAQPAPAPAQGGGGRGPGGISPDDPVLAAKKEFIQKNGLVVYRLYDHWRARKPDPFATGLAQTMGWTSRQVGGDPLRYDIPSITIGALADNLAAKLKARAGIRVVGDPQTQVRRIAMLPGVSPIAATMKAMPDCDLVLAGETREWESVEYAQDAVAAGQKKGLIMLGRVLSEEPGMNVCADWLKKLIPEAPARWLPAGDPYWRPV